MPFSVNFLENNNLIFSDEKLQEMINKKRNELKAVIQQFKASNLSTSSAFYKKGQEFMDKLKDSLAVLVKERNRRFGDNRTDRH